MWSTSSERDTFRGDASWSVFTYRTRRVLPGVGTLRADCVELGGEGRLCIDFDVPRRGVQGNVAISSADSVSSGWLCTLCVGDADVDAISASSPSHPLERWRHRPLHNGAPCIVSGRWGFAWHLHLGRHRRHGATRRPVGWAGAYGAFVPTIKAVWVMVAAVVQAGEISGRDIHTIRVPRSSAVLWANV